MGKQNGSEKASRIIDSLNRTIDRNRATGEREPDTEESGYAGVYRGKLFGMFDGSYTARRVYTPQQKG